MKKLIIFVAILTIITLVYCDTVLLITFDSATGTDIATYTPDSKDIPSAVIVSRHFNEPIVGPERHYGECCQPSPIDTGNYPDIVSAPGGAIQGGNAMFLALGTAADPTLHIGWYINYNSGVVITGDFTAEAVFMLNKIQTPSDPIQSASEWGLQNIFGNDMCPGSLAGGTMWKFRVWPNGGPIGGTGQIQLWTHDGGAEHDVDGPSVTPGVWHHAAVVYDDSADQIELFYDGVSQGTTAPNYPASPQQTDWFLGDWPSNGAARGMTGWIDAVCISDIVLDASEFVLTNPLTSAHTWEVYN